MQGLLEAAESKVTTSFTPDPICMRQARRRIRPQPCCRSPAHGRRSTGAEMEEESELSAAPSPSSSQRVSITPSSQTPCGNRDKGTICKALCAGFPETTEPAVSLSEDIKTNECLETSGDCWQHKATNITDCKDTFLGKFCECQVVEGVKLVDDGYTHCQAIGGSKGGRYMKVGPLNPRCARMGPARPCQRAA